MTRNLAQPSPGHSGSLFRLRLPDLAHAKAAADPPEGLVVLEQLIGSRAPHGRSGRRRRWLGRVLVFVALSVTIVSASALALAWFDDLNAAETGDDSHVATDESDEPRFKAPMQPRKGAAFDIGQVPPAAGVDLEECDLDERPFIEKAAYLAPREAPRRAAWLTGSILEEATPSEHAGYVP
jgi:hypothetical protein